MRKIKILLILLKTSNTKPGELRVLPTALPGPESNGNEQKNLTGSVIMKAKFILMRLMRFQNTLMPAGHYICQMRKLNYFL